MAIEPFEWECPHCSLSQIVNDSNYDEQTHHVFIKKPDVGPYSYTAISIVCSAPKCNKVTFVLQLCKDASDGYGNFPLQKNGEFYFKQLYPDAAYKKYADFIPIALREDYQESCLIRNLSPKASATLARRCLQGMIRDFCKISKPTLDQEIKALKALLEEDKAPKGVSHESVEAIDHVRTVGNIGAHMEKDVDHIVSVEPDEAQMLIDLIEMLFEEWYIARAKRQSRLDAVSVLAAEKKALKASGAPSG